MDIDIGSRGGPARVVSSRVAQLKLLQHDVQSIRNICIIAHVDHGKTTLADSLLSSNNLISTKLAGKIRYLDSRQDEQERGITIESSAISLFCSINQSVPINQSGDEMSQLISKNYLINLIDSPGHVDFSCEVGSASRLCDGGLLLVDALEGVCAQTYTVLAQAIRENVRLVLVLNKIDRLFVELKQSTDEAYIHLNNILEQINAILGGFEAQKINERCETTNNANVDVDIDSSDNQIGNSNMGSAQDKNNDCHPNNYYFSPERGNVVFASAIDGWAFRTAQFARLYASKLKIKECQLSQYMWGKHYYDPKTKSLIGPAQLNGRNLKPLFVQFALDNIWSIYNTLEKIVAMLGLKILSRDFKSKDKRALLQTIMSQWLPLSHAILVSAAEITPNPRQAQAYRMDKILNLDKSVPTESCRFKDAILACDSSSCAPMAAYMSKMFTVTKKDLPIIKSTSEIAAMKIERDATIAKYKARLLSKSNEPTSEAVEIVVAVENEVQDVLIGFARIYSGTIKIGQKIFVLGPKYDPGNRETDQYFEMIVERLFLIMGKDLEDLDQVPAGNVFGILCQSDNIFKTGTLASSLDCPSLTGSKNNVSPILKVALEPRDPTQISQLIAGIKLLNRADPCVEVIFEKTGENVIVCAGELHLERCLRDLKDRFAKIDIQASAPLVPFRETITPIPVRSSKDLPMVIKKNNTEKGIELEIRVVPLPESIRNYLMETSTAIPDPIKDTKASAIDFISKLKDLAQKDTEADCMFNAGVDWITALDSMVCFGPKESQSNILICQKLSSWTGSFDDHKKAEYHSSIVSGFNMAIMAGPLCAEPIAGILVLIDFNIQANNSMSIPGQIMSMVKDTIKQGFLQYSPRLMLAYYSCELQTDALHLGKVEAVLSRRRGRIVSEDIKDGTTLFTIKAMLPVTTSFGFVDELMKKTSGVASPQLVFHGFEVLDEDPFWVPSTEEELEELGMKSDRENLAKRYMEEVRIRKGLAVERKLVEHAEKQKTLKNK